MKNLFLSLVATFSITTAPCSFANAIEEMRNGNTSITATGTGRTTGHIANLNIQNTSDNTITIDVGPFYIPSGGQYQPYIVPSVTKVTVPAHGSENIRLNGYCIDIHIPPVPFGKDLPPFDSWITIPSDRDDLAATWKPEESNGWQPMASDKTATGLLVPGTLKPLNYTIDINKYPKEAANILLEAINRIAIAYDTMKSDNKITTPFSGFPEKERESVIQQTFWIFSSKLSGKKYVIEDFKTNTIKQYESNGQDYNKASTETKENIEKGVNDFWNTFEAVGVEAKVLTFSDDIDYDDITKESELPKPIKAGYQKYAAARALGSSHEKALEEAFASDDAQERWGDVFKRIYKNQGGK